MDNPGVDNQKEITHIEDKLTAFLQKAYKADGELIQLPKVTSRIGEPLYISVRYGQDEYQPQDSHHYLNIDVFALSDSGYVPVGMRDYEIEGNVANGNKNRHQHLANTLSAHEAADRFWNQEGVKVAETDMFKVAERYGNFLDGMSKMRAEGYISNEADWGKKVYQEMGIGSFMTALALRVLQNRGIETIQFVSLSEQAESLWTKFGRQDNQNQLDVKTAASQPYTKQSLESFIN